MIDKINRERSRLDLVSHIVTFRLGELAQSKSYVAVVVLLIAAVFFSYDLYIDILVERQDFSHVTVEASIFLAVLLALGFEVKRVLELQSSVSLSQQEIMRLKGHLAEVISNEFELWHLTATEREIALLLIKGLSMREIARLRNVKEKSVRQQATAIYAKAGVTSRYELAAYFIEDFLISSSA